MKGRFIMTAMLFLFVISYCFAAEVSGVWQGKINDQFEIVVDLKNEGPKVSGLVKSEIGEIPLTGGEFAGNEFSFKEVSFNGIAVSYIKGKIDGDKMDVVVGFQGQDFKGTLTRVK